MPARGGKRPGGGRPAGSRNKASRELKESLEELARGYAPEAIETLARIASRGKSETAQVAAATAILDRGYGKPRQSLEHGGPGGGPVIHRIEWIFDESEDPSG